MYNKTKLILAGTLIVLVTMIGGHDAEAQLRSTSYDLSSASLSGASYYQSTTNTSISSTSLSSYSSYYSFSRIYYPRTVRYSLAARNLNGVDLNGYVLDELFVVSVSLDDVATDRKDGLSLVLDGTKFKRVKTNKKGKIKKKKLKKKDLNSAVLTATLSDGSTLPIYIEKKEKRADRDDPKLIHYYVQYETIHGWQSLCGENEYGEPIGALPVMGYWDYSEGTETGGSKIEDDRAFTFACEGYVIHKCVEAGYKPWESVTVCPEGANKNKKNCEKVSLAAQHQACTRMLRADYCGDGTSYTNDDVLVSLYDGYGVRVDDEEWDVEAEWDEDGAICLADHRIDELVPHCAEWIEDDTCGARDHFFDGAVLFSELP